jgi:4a-hydroxytetrahydrobiopterin dehydratase
MFRLHELKCKTIRTGDPSLSEAEIIRLHPYVPKWDVKRVRDIQCLERVFTFGNFSEAIKFVNGAAHTAESEHHHPLILIEYDSVTLTWWTHKVNGLHWNDFIMAAKIDDLCRFHFRR